MAEFIEISREMGTNHRDLLRLLPKSVPEATITSKGDERTGATVVVENAPYGRIEIDLSKVGERRIALLCLPVTHVTFRFFGVDEETAHREYERMAKYFQRGGG
ncbi:hypothetical protein RYZ26_14850 [Terasakiella sp. A23]|uniref:hypothetical protein n=1 Tax=Terasakiella sp. FCG-A23 TaxID=3080561 RepID=UPI002955982F|nr:hypothetical protein [Terasakiella sp. A23]MDV7340883.1 hypothetical protein [Terasakiella sp. A23]